MTLLAVSMAWGHIQFELIWLFLFIIISVLCKVTIGRGLNVTHQILSVSCPLMISRNHCMFKQREHGQWTVTDNEVQSSLRLFKQQEVSAVSISFKKQLNKDWGGVITLNIMSENYRFCTSELFCLDRLGIKHLWNILLKENNHWPAAVIQSQCWLFSQIFFYSSSVIADCIY